MKTIEVEMHTTLKYTIVSTDALKKDGIDIEKDLIISCDYDDIIENEDVKEESATFRRTGNTLYVFHTLLYEMNVSAFDIGKIRKQPNTTTHILCESIKEQLHFDLMFDWTSNEYIHTYPSISKLCKIEGIPKTSYRFILPECYRKLSSHKN